MNLNNKNMSKECKTGEFDCPYVKTTKVVGVLLGVLVIMCFGMVIYEGVINGGFNGKL